MISIAAVAVWLASSQSLWADEAFSISLVRRSVPEIISFTASDVHPPLYYLLLKCAVSIFGEHWIVLRMVSVVPFVLMLLAAGSMLRREFATWTACLGTFMLAAAPGMLRYAVEIRMYSWAYLWVLLSFMTAWHLMTEEKPHWKWWIVLALCDAAAAYTHYFAGAAVLVIAAALLIVRLHHFRKMRVRTTGIWILTMAGTALLYLPWLFVFMRQAAAVNDSYWIEQLNVGTILGYWDMVIGHRSVVQQGILTAVVIASLLCLIWSIVHQHSRAVRRRQKLILLCYCIFFGYILLGILLSVVIRPVFFKRYIMIVLPLFWIAAAGSFTMALRRNRIRLESGNPASTESNASRKKRVIYSVSLGGLLCAVAISGAVSLREEISLRRSPANDTAYRYLQENLADNDVIYTNSIYTLEDLNVWFPANSRYLPGKTLDIEKFKRWDEMADVRIVRDVDACMKEIKDQSYGRQKDAASKTGAVWLVIYRDQDDTIHKLEKEGYAIEDRGAFTMGFTGWDREHIRVKIYRIALCIAG